MRMEVGDGGMIEEELMLRNVNALSGRSVAETLRCGQTGRSRQEFETDGCTHRLRGWFSSGVQGFMNAMNDRAGQDGACKIEALHAGYSAGQQRFI